MAWKGEISFAVVAIILLMLFRHVLLISFYYRYAFNYYLVSTSVLNKAKYKAKSSMAASKNRKKHDHPMLRTRVRIKTGV